MIEDDFYATIKLKTGEEIFCKVAVSEEEHKTFLILSNPVIIVEIKGKGGITGYKIEPWLKTTTEDMFIIDIDNVLTMTETCDEEMIHMHQTYLRQSDSSRSNETKISRKMGYISNVDEAKKFLEKLYKL
jgi:hypothetical protein